MMLFGSCESCEIYGKPTTCSRLISLQPFLSKLMSDEVVAYLLSPKVIILPFAEEEKERRDFPASWWKGIDKGY